MAKGNSALIERAIGGIAVAAATFVAKKALNKGWQALTGHEPPSHPEDPDVTWKEAVGWAVLSGVVIGMAQLLAARTAARYWRRSQVTASAELEHAE